MKFTAYLSILISLVWVGIRIATNLPDNSGVLTEKSYEVTYSFTLEGIKERMRINTFMPQDSDRQHIKRIPSQGTLPQFIPDQKNMRLRWEFPLQADTTISFTFEAKTRAIAYVLDPELNNSSLPLDPFEQELKSTEVIQSDADRIIKKVKALTLGSATLAERMERLYQFVYEIPSDDISTLTSALTCLEQMSCSCNGKSRLLVALLRAEGIPARMVGGLILNEGSKRTSHAWVQAYLGNEWVPFDALNGHYASIPAHYLEIYTGDEFLITRSKGIEFDYRYSISEVRSNQYTKLAILPLWDLIDVGQVPEKPVRFLLLLPIGAFLVSVFKNVIGLKSFGVFLPVLIAFSFIEIGVIPGTLFFTSVLFIIGLASSALDRWGILQTPKMVIILSITSLYCLVLAFGFLQTDVFPPSSVLVFPIVILSLIAERFARKVEEESLKHACVVYLHTLLITLACVWVLKSITLQHLLVTFPELILSVIGISLFLGKWIGLRVMEYSRFSAFNRLPEMEAHHV